MYEVKAPTPQGQVYAAHPDVRELRAKMKREQEEARMGGPRPDGRTRVVFIDVTTLDSNVRALMADAGVARLTRNSRCPCGSGKRFKRCCGRKGK